VPALVAYVGMVYGPIGAFLAAVCGLLAVLKNPTYHSKRIGLEAGPLSQ
jgi:hypothetical protein